jgi:hypothetical protein
MSPISCWHTEHSPKFEWENHVAEPWKRICRRPFEMLAALSGSQKRTLFQSRSGSALGQRNVLRDNARFSKLGWDPEKDGGFPPSAASALPICANRKPRKTCCALDGQGDKTVTDHIRNFERI